MMPIRAVLNEDVLAKLQARSDDTRRTLEHEAGLLITAALTLLPPAGRCVVVSGEPLDQLEAICGGGSLFHGPDLLHKVSRLAGISFQHVRLPFTPNQLEALAAKAASQGLPRVRA
jgi:hypothetical protein